MLFQELHQRGAFFQREMRVDTSVTVRAKALFEPGKQPGYRLTFRGEQLQKQEPGSNAVAFGYMAGEPNSAALLGTQENTAFNHFGRNVFETDARLDQLQAVGRTHLIDHRSSGQGLNDPAFALSIFDKMMQQQADQLMRRERVAAAVHASNSVGIAIGHQADVVRMLGKKS